MSCLLVNLSPVSPWNFSPDDIWLVHVGSLVSTLLVHLQLASLWTVMQCYNNFQCMAGLRLGLFLNSLTNFLTFLLSSVFYPYLNLFYVFCLCLFTEFVGFSPFWFYWSIRMNAFVFFGKEFYFIIITSVTLIGLGLVKLKDTLDSSVPFIQIF